MTDSRYPERYFSESKREHLALESMATRHLCAAFKKLRANDAEHHTALLTCMTLEIAGRGVDPETL